MGNTAGRALPFKAGAPIAGFQHGSGAPWQVLEGAPTSDPSSQPAVPGQTLHSNVNIFRVEKKTANSPADVVMAQNAMKRLKMLRHPYVLRVIDGGETEEAIMMVTEPAVPLNAWLKANKPRPGSPAAFRTDFAAACVWGTYTLVTALNFLASCELLHGNVTLDSVWVTRGGDWKLGGFELCVEAGGGDSVTFPSGWFVENDARGPCAEEFKAPERVARDWAAAGMAPRSCLDAYSAGVVLLQAFFDPNDGGAVPAPDAVVPVLRNAADVKGAAFKIGSPASPVPPALRSLLTRLLSPVPRQRPTFAEVLGSEYFRHPLVGALLFLDELALKEPADKARFFKGLPALLPRFPSGIAKYRILPALMTALEYGAAGGGGTVVLAPILEIGSALPLEEYNRAIVPCVVRLFASNDRATRVQLLHHMPSYIEKLPDDVINGSVLTHVMTGFADTNPVLRESTVKACLPLAPRLTSANLTGVLLKALRRSLVDPEAPIRVNTTICIGRIAALVVEPKEREDTVLGAYLRSMRDPFPHARVAALKAATFTVSQEGGAYWPTELLAKKVMTAACYCCIDSHADARAAAFALMEAGATVLKGQSAKRALEDDAKAAATAAALAAAGEAGEGATAPASTAGGGIMGSASTALGIGWAVFSSITNKVLPTGNIGEGGGVAAPAAPSVTTPAASPLSPATSASFGSLAAAAGGGSSGSGAHAVPKRAGTSSAARAGGAATTASLAAVSAAAPSGLGARRLTAPAPLPASSGPDVDIDDEDGWGDVLGAGEEDDADLFAADVGAPGKGARGHANGVAASARLAALGGAGTAAAGASRPAPSIIGRNNGTAAPAAASHRDSDEEEEEDGDGWGPLESVVSAVPPASLSASAGSKGALGARGSGVPALSLASTSKRAAAASAAASADDGTGGGGAGWGDNGWDALDNAADASLGAPALGAKKIPAASKGGPGGGSAGDAPSGGAGAAGGGMKLGASKAVSAASAALKPASGGSGGGAGSWEEW